jgi:hypothetical protein
MDAKLKVQTRAPRRELPSDWFELAPIAAYGTEGRTAMEAPARAALLVDDGEVGRYLWTEDRELRRIDVEVHPGRPSAGRGDVM